MSTLPAQTFPLTSLPEDVACSVFVHFRSAELFAWAPVCTQFWRFVRSAMELRTEVHLPHDKHLSYAALRSVLAHCPRVKRLFLSPTRSLETGETESRLDYELSPLPLLGVVNALALGDNSAAAIPTTLPPLEVLDFGARDVPLPVASELFSKFHSLRTVCIDILEHEHTRLSSWRFLGALTHLTELTVRSKTLAYMPLRESGDLTWLTNLEHLRRFTFVNLCALLRNERKSRVVFYMEALVAALPPTVTQVLVESYSERWANWKRTHFARLASSGRHVQQISSLATTWTTPSTQVASVLKLFPALTRLEMNHLEPLLLLDAPLPNLTELSCVSSRRCRHNQPCGYGVDARVAEDVYTRIVPNLRKAAFSGLACTCLMRKDAFSRLRSLSLEWCNVDSLLFSKFPALEELCIDGYTAFKWSSSCAQSGVQTRFPATLRTLAITRYYFPSGPARQLDSTLDAVARSESLSHVFVDVHFGFAAVCQWFEDQEQERLAKRLSSYVIQGTVYKVPPSASNAQCAAPPTDGHAQQIPPVSNAQRTNGRRNQSAAAPAGGHAQRTNGTADGIGRSATSTSGSQDVRAHVNPNASGRGTHRNANASGRGTRMNPNASGRGTHENPNVSIHWTHRNPNARRSERRFCRAMCVNGEMRFDAAAEEIDNAVLSVDSDPASVRHYQAGRSSRPTASADSDRDRVGRDRVGRDQVGRASRLAFATAEEQARWHWRATKFFGRDDLFRVTPMKARADWDKHEVDECDHLEPMCACVGLGMFEHRSIV